MQICGLRCGLFAKGDGGGNPPISYSIPPPLLSFFFFPNGLNLVVVSNAYFHYIFAIDVVMFAGNQSFNL